MGTPDLDRNETGEVTAEQGEHGAVKSSLDAGKMKEATDEKELSDDELAEDINPEDTECGVGLCRPKGLQCCARLIFFTLALSLAGFCSHITGPFFVSQVTSVERHFELNSTQIGGLMSTNDISFLIVVLLVSHFCKDSHSPRILSVAFMAFGMSCVAIAAMNFASPRTLQDLEFAGANRTKDNTKYLCIAGATSRTFDEGCTGGKGDESNNKLSLVVVFGLMLGIQGIGKATRAPLGTTYIDNNVKTRAKTGFHIGVMFTFVLMGPAVGFAMGGVFSRIPVDLSDVSLSPQDPRWIGAWWLGFLVVGLATMASSLLLFFFPRRMPRRKRVAEGHDDKAEEMKEKDGNRNAPCKDKDISVPAATPTDEKNKGIENNGSREVPVEKEKPAHKLKSLAKDLPLSIYRLIQRPVFVLLLIALGMTIFAVVGFSSFLIKFVERQFGLPAWQSSSIFGLCNLVFGGIGTFAGGVLVSRMNLTRRGCLRWVVFAGCMSAILSAITMFLGCGNKPIIGLHRKDLVYDDGKSVCQCDVSQYLPVCVGQQSFLSPCHAGCTRTANSSVYENCSASEDGYATVGLCDPACYLLIPFIAVQVLSTVFGTSSVTPVYITILRSASEKDKTLAMGMVAFVMSIIGFIPAPIVYGAVIDTACILWSSTCGRSGACALYDVTALRQRYIGLETGFKALAVLFYAAALLTLEWRVRTGREEDEKVGKKETSITITNDETVLTDKPDNNGSAVTDGKVADKEGARKEGVEMTKF